MLTVLSKRIDTAASYMKMPVLMEPITMPVNRGWMSAHYVCNLHY